MANIRGKVLSVCAALLLAGSFLMVPEPAAAQQQVTTITSFADLLSACLSSRTMDTSNVHYVLDLHDAKDKTLDLSSDQVDGIVQQIGSLTFGSKDNPFKGTFDGQGYTIKGLNYERKLFVPAPDTGLFAWTDGATIKNINFEDAYIGADYRGGVIAGYAKNSSFEHIKLTNCTSSVTPANNAVSLVTNAGLAGGMVAGEAEGCAFYDIEVEGGSVINNSTIAVSGLGGEGLYLGAIAGIAEGSTIEYCRALPIRSLGADGKVAYTYPRVHNKYDVAVGAVSGQAVYAGGIAGAIGKGTRVIDSFSTADCYTYAATYVSVGAGNVGYVGGIAARSDNGSQITRCHYAGNLHSYLYNALLVIPIIQKNVYLGGIVQQDNDADCAIRDTYFKPSVSSVLDPGTNKDLPSINDRRNRKVYSGASFVPRTTRPTPIARSGSRRTSTSRAASSTRPTAWAASPISTSGSWITTWGFPCTAPPSRPRSTFPERARRPSAPTRSSRATRRRPPPIPTTSPSRATCRAISTSSSRPRRPLWTRSPIPS